MVAYTAKRARGGRRTAGLTIAFHASITSASDTITIPATVIDNDVGILFDFGTNASGTAPAKVVPTNWTELDSDVHSPGSVGDCRYVVSYRKLTTALAGTSVTGINGGAEDKCMLIFRPSQAVTTVAAGDPDSELTTGNPAAQTVTASGGAAPLVVLGASWEHAGDAAFSSASPAFDAEVTSADADLKVGYTVYNASPSDHTIDQNDLGGEQALTTLYVTFAL